MDVLSNTVRLLAGRMDYLSGRHSVLTENIANMETPNYKSKDVIFEGYVNEGVELSANTIKPKLSVTQDNSPGNEVGNTVSFETQTAYMADNSIEFITVSEAAKRYLNLMRMAIGDK